MHHFTTTQSLIVILCFIFWLVKTLPRDVLHVFCIISWTGFVFPSFSHGNYCAPSVSHLSWTRINILWPFELSGNGQRNFNCRRWVISNLFLLLADLDTSLTWTLVWPVRVRPSQENRYFLKPLEESTEMKSIRINWKLHQFFIFCRCPIRIMLHHHMFHILELTSIFKLISLSTDRNWKIRHDLTFRDVPLWRNQMLIATAQSIILEALLLTLHSMRLISRDVFIIS